MAALDNPVPPARNRLAAGQLVNILNQLRKSASGAKPKLASVRQMTKPERTDRASTSWS
jgi:hypothetical protein